MEKHQFKPFDQVLVRDNDEDTWVINHYGHLHTINGRELHICAIGSSFLQCIPYNEETKHLLGTNKPYTKPQPKTYWVEWIQNGDAHRVKYTDEEFENFIKISVLHNKDIQNFDVRKICG